MSYREHSSLDTEEKLKRILRIIKQNKILLMQGKLSPEEQTQLIEETMLTGKKGVYGTSFCIIDPNQNGNKPFSIKDSLYNLTFGKRDILTIIGPATVIKEIRKNPAKIDLLLQSKRRR